MSGLHKSPFKGFSVEFAEHRQYGPGDEIRHIDWRAFGKTDRYFVKEYEEETNLKAYLVVDASGSMGYAGRTASKFEHARRLAAALAYLMISQRDAVGLVTFDTESAAMIPPRSAPGHFSVLCKAMEETPVGGETPLERRAPHPGRADQAARAGRSSSPTASTAPTTWSTRCGTSGTAGTRSCSSRRSPPRRRSSRSAAPPSSATWNGPAHDLRVNPAALRATYLERSRRTAAPSARGCSGWTPTTTRSRPPSPTSGPCSTTSPPARRGADRGAEMSLPHLARHPIPRSHAPRGDASRPLRGRPSGPGGRGSCRAGGCPEANPGSWEPRPPADRTTRSVGRFIPTRSVGTRQDLRDEVA